MGGLARRATKVASLRQESDAFLLLDAGMAFPRRKEEQALKAEIVLGVMDYLKYDAFNLGKNEFSLGAAFLTKVREKISIPLVTSNLVYADNNERTWAEPYIVKEIRAARVAVFGVLPVDVLNDCQADFPELVVVPPEKALSALIPRIRKQVDVVIVLSSCGYLETIDLVEKISGVDLAISSGRLASTMIKTDKSPVFQAGMKGEKLGVVKLSIDGNSGEVTCEHSLTGLYANIPDDPQVVEIIRKAHVQE